MSEHDFEPIRGLPGKLPEGEKVLWQGAPDWRALAQEAFHVRAVAAYFSIMLVWRVISAAAGGQALLSAVQSALLVAPIALVALGVLAMLAWLNARTTVYTITNRRVVMRFGVALPKAINIPFAIVEGAAIKPLADRAGDLALSLKAPNKIAFLHLWPHARPWRLAAPQPTLRAIPDAQTAGAVLASAMRGETPVETTPAIVPAREYARPAAASGSPEIAPA